MLCVIDGISHKGEGIAHIEGKATFIPFALPNETVKVKITEEKRKYNRAQLIEIIRPSPNRIEPLCPHYYECGACSYQHVNYSQQLEMKRKIVEENINRIGKLVIEVPPLIPAEKPYRYRNKVSWQIVNKSLGYYQAGTNKLVKIHACKLISQKMEEATNRLRDLLVEMPLTAKSNMIMRESSTDGKIMLILTNLTKELDEEIMGNLSGIVDNLYVNYLNEIKYTKIFGSDKINEEAKGAKILLSPLAFFQVNHLQMEKIIEILEGYLALKKDDILLDAYCGVGSLSLPLANKVSKVIAIESYALAIEDAENNALINNINNCEFLVGHTERILPKLNKTFNKIIVDPPRIGLREEVIRAISKANPEKIAYVSCNPATLARDLAIFSENGYITKEIQPIDMFPQTGHVECVTLMSRVKD